MKYNFCCGITLFNPNISEIENLKKISSLFDRVIVYDNSKFKSKEKFKSNFLDNTDKFIYISHNKNNGLSRAYNEIFYTAHKLNYDFICILDQDSILLKDNFFEIISFIDKNHSNKTAIYAPKMIHQGSSKKHRVTINKMKNINWCISSGSIFNLKSFLEIKKFDENYFIDRLDLDYCKRVIQKGYYIKLLYGYNLYQKLGTKRKLFGINYYEHNPMRHYYIYRNRLYYYHKFYEKRLLMKFKLLLLNFFHLIRILFIELDKVKKLNYIKKARNDFKTKKFGRINEN